MSKHTKAGRHARRRAHHEAIAAEAWGEYQGRRLAAWMRAQMLASPFAAIRAEAARVTTVAVST